MEKEQLRNQLFDKYFEVKDGINICDMMKQLKFISQTYKTLKKMLEEQIEDYDSYDTIDVIKEIEIKENKYIIMQISLFDCIVIDVKNNKLLNRKEALEIFPDINSVFKKINNVGMLYFYKSNNDLKNIVNYYYLNKKTFDMPTKIDYQIKLEDAWTYIFFNLEQGNICLGFQAKDQFLYEQLFLKSDVTPSGMQDAQSKIGIERMKEMFELIREIKIPYEIIPSEYEIEKEKQYKK